MQTFINDNFMLEGDAARQLYHRHAATPPIIDFHNHLNAAHIKSNYAATTISEMWLGGDHYKWRAMRANGIDESLITGVASSPDDDFRRFAAWAATLPQAMRNPLYHWTHLELKRYFGIDTILSPLTARAIYNECNRQIAAGGFGARDLLRRMKVESVGTTDDPCDSLESHIASNALGDGIEIWPTWRPDRLMGIDNTLTFKAYIDSLATATGVVSIATFDDLLGALKLRQAHFAAAGCRASDHGLDMFYADAFTDAQADSIFRRALRAQPMSDSDISVFRSAMLYHLAVMNHRAGWVQQFHIGPLRNNNIRLLAAHGPDIGCDSIGDRPQAEAMGRFLGRLDAEGVMAKTIVYNLNPKDTEVITSMIYNFNDGSTPGKMQYGAAWWFLDQISGMTRQIDALSSLGLLGRFVGMLTDSRSFLSFPRHEYFRRLLCNILGGDVERGLLPASEIDQIGQMVENISYNNAKGYFGGGLR